MQSFFLKLFFYLLRYVNMTRLKAWLVKPKNSEQKPFIQTQFPMMDLDYHDVYPLFIHPTALESVDLSMIEKRFDISALQGNLVLWKDLPSDAQVWD